MMLTWVPGASQSEGLARHLLRSWDPLLAALGVNIPDAWLAESSPAMTSATLPSGYRYPPLRTYPHVPGKPRQYIVAQPACTYLVLDTLKD